MDILLVDQSQTMRCITRRALEQMHGVRIIEAKDGVEAMGALSQPFDVVLLERDMPRMDGLTLAKKIRETRPGLPMVMLSPKSDRASVVQAIRTGISAYVVKPFTPEVLIERVTAAVKRDPAAAPAD